jgi:hypothetical protein
MGPGVNSSGTTQDDLGFEMPPFEQCWFPIRHEPQGYQTLQPSSQHKYYMAGNSAIPGYENEGRPDQDLVDPEGTIHELIETGEGCVFSEETVCGFQ